MRAYTWRTQGGGLRGFKPPPPTIESSDILNCVFVQEYCSHSLNPKFSTVKNFLKNCTLISHFA